MDENIKEKKGKERKSICIVLFWQIAHSQSAQTWITQFYLQITPFRDVTAICFILNNIARDYSS